MDLSIQIAKILEEYGQKVAENVDEIAAEVAQEAIVELKQTSPKKRGKYAKGWRKRKLKSGRWVVYNFKYGNLTHLLEYGHVKRNGGRTRAFPHIKQAELNMIKKFIDRLKEIGTS